MSDIIQDLERLLNDAVKDLKSTSAKKMFGCHAIWSNDQVFALVWKHGRLGFKLPDTDTYGELMGKTGADPWKAGPKQMAHWVLVPESFHKKPAELKKWAAKAQELCSKLEAKPAKKKAAITKPSKTSAVKVKTTAKVKTAKIKAAKKN